MKVIDLIIKLNQLPQNADVRINLTNENMDMFMFGPIVYADTIETDEDGEFVLLSHYDPESVEEDEEIDPKMN